MTGAELVETAKSLGVSFRVNLKGKVFARITRTLPPGLLEQLRENKALITEHVKHTASSHVWQLIVDGRRVRVIDPGRSKQADFESSMQRQFGKDRVGLCTRLWPEETR